MSSTWNRIMHATAGQEQACSTAEAVVERDDLDPG
jgi:hypothetical protein